MLLTWPASNINFENQYIFACQPNSLSTGINIMPKPLGIQASIFLKIKVIFAGLNLAIPITKLAWCDHQAHLML